MNRPSETPDPAPQRRGFMAELLAIAVGGIVSVSGLFSAIWAFLDPLTRRPQPPASRGPSRGPEGFVRIAAAESVPTDGSSQRFPVIADQLDAWNYTPDQPIGAVYLRRLPDGQVLCLQSTCPHAGCSISPSPEGAAYHCPCHNSSFDLDGNKMSRPGKDNPSPRTMDTLQVSSDMLAQGEIWIKYEDFYTGIEEKKPKI